MGLAAIASVSTAYALMQDVQSPKGVQVEHSGILGHLSLVLYGPDGQIQTYRQTDNLVVLNGDNATSNKLFYGSQTGARKLSVCTGGSTCSGNSVNAFQWIGVGHGNVGPFVTDTTLANQDGTDKLGTVSNGTGSHGSAQIQVTFQAGKITNGSNANIQEAALFDFSANGGAAANMFARQVFSAISVGPADTLQITWNITIT